MDGWLIECGAQNRFLAQWFLGIICGKHQTLRNL